MDIDKWEKEHLDGTEFKLKGEFSNQQNRTQVLDRAEQYAGWTLPYIFPSESYSQNEEMQNDFQSIGALCVNNLANKIMMTLFQPSRPFFKMELTKDQIEELAEGMTEADVDSGLAETEREAMRLFLRKHGRVALTETVIQLIITGNCMFYFNEAEKKSTYYSVRNYAVWRDLIGEPTKIIIHQQKNVGSLSDGLADSVRAVLPNALFDDVVNLYTGIQRIGNKYIVWQELEDLAYCHTTTGRYDIESLPWKPLTWNLAPGNDYGTGLVENYAGDFGALSRLSQVSNEYAAVLTDIKNLVNPAGMTDVSDMIESKSGAYVLGREEDIFLYQPTANGAGDFIDSRIDKIERRLGAAFLLNSAVTRDAERVTAAEIRMQAQELEQSLGGVYSRLSADLQYWLAKMLMKVIQPAFKDVEPAIVTGLESLSRSSDTDRWRYFFQDMVAMAEVPEEVRIRTNFGNLIAILGAGHGVDYKKVLLSEEEVEQERARITEQNAAMAGQEAGAVAQAQGQTQ